MRFRGGRLLIAALASALPPTMAAAQTLPNLKASPQDQADLQYMQRNGLNVRTAVLTTFDSNIVRTDADLVPSAADLIVSPTLEARFNRTTPLASFSLSGLVAYDQYVDNSERSRPRFLGGVDGDVRVFGTCSVKPTASFRRERADYGDLNVQVENLQSFSTLGATVECPRSSGFYPSFGYLRSTSDNDRDFDYADQRTNSYSAAIAYAKPSLGVVRLSYTRDNSTRPNVGVRTQVNKAGVIFDRAISSILAAHIDVHALWTDSTPAVIDRYEGAGWDIRLTTRAVPRWLLSLQSSRKITNDTLVASGYALETSYGLVGRGALSELFSIDASIERRDRRFEQNPLAPAQRIGSDNLFIANAQARRRVSERFAIIAGGTYITRQTNNGLAEYNDVQGRLGFEAYF
ncbi:hypothetical protein [Sphingomonas spermidinifaciens]|nr:hypothetical protein [Sphingomonas spermidinifaciens]